MKIQSCVTFELLCKFLNIFANWSGNKLKNSKSLKNLSTFRDLCEYLYQTQLNITLVVYKFLANQFVFFLHKGLKNETAIAYLKIVVFFNHPSVHTELISSRVGRTNFFSQRMNCSQNKKNNLRLNPLDIRKSFKKN